MCEHFAASGTKVNVTSCLKHYRESQDVTHHVWLGLIPHPLTK